MLHRAPRAKDRRVPDVDRRKVALYSALMIKSFRHKGLEALFRAGIKAGVRPDHVAKLKTQLFALDLAKSAADMNAPGWRLHRLTGRYRGHWSVAVSGNWRLVFRFEGTDAQGVDYLDYH